MLWISICCHFHFDVYSLTNQRRANPRVIYLGSLILVTPTTLHSSLKCTSHEAKSRATSTRNREPLIDKKGRNINRKECVPRWQREVKYDKQQSNTSRSSVVRIIPVNTCMPSDTSSPLISDEIC